MALTREEIIEFWTENSTASQKWNDIYTGKVTAEAYESARRVVEQEADKQHSIDLERFQGIITRYKTSYSDTSLQAVKNIAGRDAQFIDLRGNKREGAARTNKEFISNARDLYYRNVKAEEIKIQRDFDTKYNAEDSTINTALQDVLDKPISVTNGIMKDIGLNAGKIQGKFTEGVSKVFGKDSRLDKYADATKSAVNIASSFGKDVESIATASPLMNKAIKKLADVGADIDPKKATSFWGEAMRVSSNRMKGSLYEFADILNEWYHDPKVLCCFIKNLAALAKIGSIDEIYGGKEWKDISATREFIDKMIAMLKLARDFLRRDIPFEVMVGIDLGVMMSRASSAALMATLASLQEMLEAAIYEKLLEYAQSMPKRTRVCLPFERLFKLLSDILSGPDGIFAYIGELIDSFLISLSSNLSYGYHTGLKSRMADVTAIDKLIDLLESIRDAVLNLELCIEADFIESEGDSSETTDNLIDTTPGFELSSINGVIGRSVSNSLGRDYNDLNKKITKQVIFPTDNEIKTFITARLGETDAFADQVIESAHRTSQVTVDSADTSDDINSNIDKFTSAIGDCARTLNPDKIAEMATLIAEWDL